MYNDQRPKPEFAVAYAGTDKRRPELPR